VPSSTLKDPGRNTHVINGDVEAAVRELKAKPGRELQVYGSGDLLRWLLQRDLVDEINLRLYPVVVGDGLRLFPERGQHARPDAGRVAVGAVRRDDPDLSTGRPRDLRDRRLRAQRLGAARHRTSGDRRPRLPDRGVDNRRPRRRVDLQPERVRVGGAPDRHWDSAADGGIPSAEV